MKRTNGAEAARAAKEALATNVVVGRARHRLSQTKLAELAGISRPTISRLEREEGDTTVDILGRIAHALGTSVMDLFVVEDNTDTVTSDAELERRAQSKPEGSVDARELLKACDEASGFDPRRYSQAGRPRRA